eukprot:17322-Eustigmatos_ZCMA.PRE.1
MCFNLHQIEYVLAAPAPVGFRAGLPLWGQQGEGHSSMRLRIGGSNSEVGWPSPLPQRTLLQAS